MQESELEDLRRDVIEWDEVSAAEGKLRHLIDAVDEVEELAITICRTGKGNIRHELEPNVADMVVRVIRPLLKEELEHLARRKRLMNGRMVHPKPRSGWISVDERLPDEGLCVWAWGLLGDYPKPGIHQVRVLPNGWEHSSSDRQVTNATHWMPLPKSP